MKTTHTVYRLALAGLWGLALVGLPMTSFPLFTELTGAIVTPFSALPVLLLVGLWLVPHLLRGGALPLETRPFVVFILVLVAVSAGAFFLEIPGFRGRTVLGQELRAFVTVAIGASFYLLFSAFPRDEAGLRRTLRWVHAGGIILLLWAMLQIYIMQMDMVYPRWALNIEEWLAVRTPYFRTGGHRVTGFAYEPSWFSHQMVILYIPLWYSASYYQATSFGFRLGRLTVENILAVIGTVAFFFSSPRVSLIAFFLLFVFLFAKVNLALYRRLLQRVSYLPALKSHHQKGSFRFLTGLVLTFVVLSLYTVFTLTAFNAASQRDWRLAALRDNPPSTSQMLKVLTLDEKNVLAFSHRFFFLERTTYWFTGWRVFNHYPWFGVGLGNTGFFALQETPGMGWGSFEVRDYLYHMEILPNVKSLWVRLLSESGLVGFFTFATWLLVLLFSARLTARSSNPLFKHLALAGQLVLVALLAEGFSIDSFAMPYLWVAMGLVSASGLIFRRQAQAQASAESGTPLPSPG
jgi:hypothetical protein